MSIQNRVPHPLKTDSPTQISFPSAKPENDSPRRLSDSDLERPSFFTNYLAVFSTTEGEILILSTILKVLLFPAYRSTDFEVHRNWLAITHSLPLSKWYYDTTSEWTLDYPPFFAYFEYIMSIPAYILDPKIVNLDNLYYDAWSVIAYQRTTVILTELVLGAAALRFIRGAADPATQKIISISLFLHPGFLIVDHIHFQYNGFMFGILLWSLLAARNGNKLLSGSLFAILLNFKHIYMYIAPAYFIYLLRSYCMTPQARPNLPNFLSLANAVIVIFAFSLGPFVLMGQTAQLLSRLFPFTRGLNHAYWAPNAWALVTALDRVLLRFAKSSGANINVNISGVSATSRGLVGDTIFAVLPNIRPIHTFLITLTFQIIFLIKLWLVPTYKSFLTTVTLCGYASFMFGWHVHEKAVLLILVPLSLLAGDSHAMFRTYFIATVAGIYGLFPLLFTPAENFVEIAYSVIWGALCLQPLSQKTYDIPSTLSSVILDRLERAYLFGFGLLQLFVTLLNARAQQSLEFLPLLLTSVYCSVGLAWAFIRLSYLYLKRI
ncbi:glycosyltransferase family 57 protein [Hysterangium stoloniferum]|nr:glycosyltransferase family 57 protein [Hysterangium stoloniferum]